MNHWLEADPEDILDEVILARQLAGEDLDETSQRTRAMIRNDIASSQRQIAASVVESGAGIEARLDSRASVTIKEIRSRSGEPLREDLWGIEHSLRPTRPVATP